MGTSEQFYWADNIDINEVTTEEFKKIFHTIVD